MSAANWQFPTSPRSSSFMVAHTYASGGLKPAGYKVCKGRASPDGGPCVNVRTRRAPCDVNVAGTIAGMTWLLIGVGGAIGAIARHGLNHLVHQRWISSVFPIGIFLINVTGSIII